MKHNHGLRHKGSAIDLMQREPSFTPSITKAEAEISTTSANALGTVDGPHITRENSSAALAQNEKQLNEAKIRFQGAHTYSGRDPNVLRLLDALYLENRPLETTEFGPSVVPVERRQWEKKGVKSPGGHWQPEGVLVATFSEHTGAVSRVIVAPDHSFFITGSDDGSVKIWDSARLERNLAHRSKQTYRHAAEAKITSLCFIQKTHCFVSTASDGSVHVVKVDYTEVAQGTAKYGKLRLLREYTLPNFSSYVVWSEHIKPDGRSMLLMATNTSQIHALDLKTMELVYTLENPVHHGTPTCFCVDTQHHWLLLGTSHGILDLHDLRFQLRVKSWGFPGASPIHRVCLHPTHGSRKRQVVVAGGTGAGDITIWDLERMACKEVFRTASGIASSDSKANQRPVDPTSLKPYIPWFPDSSSATSLLSRFLTPPHPPPSTSSNIPTKPSDGTQTDRSTRPPLPTSKSSTAPSNPHAPPNVFEIAQADRSVRALCTGFRPSLEADREPRHGYLIAAGPDRKVRFWDLDRVDSSRVISGLDTDELQPGFVARSLVGTDGTECVVCEERLRVVSAEAEDTRRKGSSRDRSTGGRGQRSTVVSLQQQRLLKTHLDIVLDIALLEYPVHMVVSVDRSGAVYVFQ